LSRRANSLIFHNKTAPDIISSIFGKYGAVAQFQNKLTKSYPTLEYTVQHRETDLAFVCRLMEQHGITYHFTYADGQHTLILGDGVSAYFMVPELSRPLRPWTASDFSADKERITKWMAGRRLTTGKYTLNDYDFQRPNANLVVTQPGVSSYENGHIEYYDHPGKYVTTDDGNKYGRVGIEMNEATDGHQLAEGNCLSLAAGMRMTLTTADGKSEKGEYLALHCQHRFYDQSYFSGSGPGPEQEPYSGKYELILSSVQYAPPMVTPKPFIAGPQTAKVVGSGEIDCDEFGRILVHFHWNRESPEVPEGQSMRCRVAQVWSGAKWGGIFIPRVDMEVLVQFLDGDPDRPIVIGCVYNGDNKPPYDLPSKKNIAGWKSNSTKGGGGYNEYIFDDTKGSELVRGHAQKDMEWLVEHDERRHIKHDRTTDIDHDDNFHTKHDRKGTIDHDDTLDVGHEISITAKSKITLTVGESTIVMEPDKITLTSLNIEVTAQLDLQTKGLSATHQGMATLEISAPMVTINS
jgi:type VI secretion system secreted protein VgrG